jgi:predicted RecB family nuclease
MLITTEIFRAFLNCKTKSYLKSSGNVGSQHQLIEWKRSCLTEFKQKCLLKLRASFEDDECLVGLPSLQALENSTYRLITDCVLQAQGLRSHLDVLERFNAPIKGKHSTLIPIRFLPNEKITKHDKLILAFDALVLFTACGELPPFGKIIHGHEQRTVKVKLANLMETTKALVSEIVAQQTSTTPPELVLNKHCPECEFQPRCRQIAVETDELTLLSRMSEKERKQYHNKGIFSVTQLSYTFRPRRRPKRSGSKPQKYSHELKALAIREGKIHIAGRPELNIKGNPVYLDVEGIPDQDFYYLIG